VYEDCGYGDFNAREIMEFLGDLRYEDYRIRLAWLGDYNASKVFLLMETSAVGKFLNEDYEDSNVCVKLNRGLKETWKLE